jgi:hypothetical protein
MITISIPLAVFVVFTIGLVIGLVLLKLTLQGLIKNDKGLLQ